VLGEIGQEGPLVSFTTPMSRDIWSKFLTNVSGGDLTP